MYSPVPPDNYLIRIALKIAADKIATDPILRDLVVRHLPSRYGAADPDAIAQRLIQLISTMDTHPHTKDISSP
jgi:hypothetical protein